MDYNRICQSEGYRIEDLTPEHREVMEWLMAVRDRFDSIDFDADYSIVREIADDVIEHAKDYLEMCIQEVQISLAESEGE